MILFRKKKSTKETSFTAAMVNVSNSVHGVADEFDARCGFISSVADAMTCINCQQIETYFATVDKD